MSTPNRYDIGYGPLKGPELELETGSAGTSVSTVTQCTISPGLPTIRGRRPGDQHVDNTDPDNLLEYVLAGEVGVGFTDDFNRANGTFINGGGVTGWVQYPAGIDNAWAIDGNAAKGFGEFRMLSRPFGPRPITTATTLVKAGSTGHPGIYTHSLDKGGQLNGYFFQVKLGATSTNVFIKRGGVIKNSLYTGAAINAPAVLTISVNTTTGLVSGSVDGTEVITWTDPAPQDATGGYVGIGTGFTSSDTAFFDYFIVEEPGKNLRWLPVGGGGGISEDDFATLAPPAVDYDASQVGGDFTVAHGNHTHQSVQFAYDFVVVT